LCSSACCTHTRTAAPKAGFAAAAAAALHGSREDLGSVAQCCFCLGDLLEERRVCRVRRLQLRDAFGLGAHGPIRLRRATLKCLHCSR
jgi:hypothetical protein